MILLTGASGVIGNALIEQFERAKVEYSVLSHAMVNLLDFEATRARFQAVAPTIVVHLAARVHGLMGNKRYPAEMFRENVLINTNVIEAAHLSGCKRIIAAGTVAAYPSNTPMPMQESSVWNGPPHGSEWAYANAKRAMLAHLEAAHVQYGISFAYPMFTNIYGPHDRFDVANGHVIPSLIAKFHEAATKGTAVEVWGTGVAERDFIFSEDAARAIMPLLSGFEGPINIASGNTIPIRQTVEILARHSGVADVQWNSTMPDGQLTRSYDVSKLRSLGFECEVSLEKGLQATYNWYSANFPNVRS